MVEMKSKMKSNMKSKSKLKVPELMKKVEFYEGLKKLFVELAVEIISGVIAKLISGGARDRQPLEAA